MEMLEEKQMTSSTIDNAIKYIKSIFKNNTDGHDINHSIRVYKNALNLVALYSDCDRQTIALAALLHDVDDHKLFHSKNNANARHFLEMQNLNSSKIEKICTIINEVSFSKNRGKTPTSLEGKIVQDADRLDAIGAIGIARVFAYGGKMGKSIEDSVQHFYDKLLLLKNEMNTEEAKKIATARDKYLRKFLKEFNREIRETDVGLT